MTEVQIPVRENERHSAARKYAFQGLVHTSVMLTVGWISGRNGHPVVESVFYSLGLIAAAVSAYFAYRHFTSVRASKAVKH